MVRWRAAAKQGTGIMDGPLFDVRAIMLCIFLPPMVRPSDGGPLRYVTLYFVSFSVCVCFLFTTNKGPSRPRMPGIIIGFGFGFDSHAHRH